jgi:hypothetical protein
MEYPARRQGRSLSEQIIAFGKEEDGAIRQAKAALAVGDAYLATQWLALAEYYQSKASEVKALFF